jgi:hypothetical protein
LFWTLPGRGFIYIFDPNAVASLEGLDVDYEIFSPDLLDINVHPLSSKKAADKVIKATQPLAYVKFEEKLDEHLESSFLESYDWVGMDSFTTFSDAVMDRVSWMNERFGKQPEQADWSAQMMVIQGVARSITHRNKMFIATAHEEYKQDEKTKIILAQPWLTGRLKIRLPLLFSNIYRTVADDGKFFIQTTPYGMHKYMRSSLKGLEPEIDVTIPVDPHKRRFVNPQEHGIGRLLRDTGYLPRDPKVTRMPVARTNKK